MSLFVVCVRMHGTYGNLNDMRTMFVWEDADAKFALFYLLSLSLIGCAFYLVGILASSMIQLAHVS